MPFEDTEAPVISRSAELGCQFRSDFQDIFDSAASNHGVGLFSRQKFDQWCVTRSLLSALPENFESGSELRDGLVAQRNQIRSAINSAALYNQCGWPPFEVAVESGEIYAVRLIERYLSSLPADVAQKLSKTVMNKLSGMDNIAQTYRNDTRLPADLRQGFYTSQTICGMVLNSVEFQLRQCVDQFNSNVKRAQEFLTNAPKGQEG